MKTIILTEQQTNKIIKSIINENTPGGSESITINFGAVWGMGKWKLTKNQTNVINTKLNTMVNFIKKNEGNNIVVQIESGESQITNADTEVNPPIALERGVLAKRRGDVIVNYLRRYFSSLEGKTLTKDEIPEIPDPKVVIGQLPYKKGVTNLKDPKVVKQFQSEQFVKATISVKNGYDCMVGLQVEVGYFPGKNKSNHTCDEAIFQLRMNGVPVGLVNLNNGEMDIEITKYKLNGANAQITPYLKRKAAPKHMTLDSFVRDVVKKHDEVSVNRKSDNKKGGSRSQTFMINSALASSIINQSKQETIKFSVVPLVGPNTKFQNFYEVGTHSDTPWIKITNTRTNEVYYDAEPNVKLKRGSLEETVLLVTDKCGEPIKNPQPQQ